MTDAQRKTNGRTHAKLGGGGLDDARVAVADVADVVDAVKVLVPQVVVEELTAPRLELERACGLRSCNRW